MDECVDTVEFFQYLIHKIFGIFHKLTMNEQI